jgi:hypothetical protein
MNIGQSKKASYLKNLWVAKIQDFSSIKRLFFYIFFIELVALLAMQGLNYNCFWDDEAETAIMAKNLLLTGRLTGWDGRNLCACRNGSAIDKNFRPINPPGMYLTTAAFFGLFGCTTNAGRYPFVILGIVALFILFWMLRDAYPSLPAFVRYGVALTGLSTSYLLYIRQCRYYALCIFFSLLALAFYRAVLKKPRWALFAGLGASLTALYFSHYLIMICFTGALLAGHFAFHARDWGRKDYFRAALTGALFLLPIVCFSVLSKAWIRPDMAGGAGAPTQILARLYLNFRDFDAFGMLPGVLAAAGVIYALLYRKKCLEARLFLEFGFFIAAYIVALSVISPQSMKGGLQGKLADMRYMVVLIPIGALCTAAILSIIHGKMKLPAILLFCIITCTNLLCLRLSVPQVRLLLPAYVYEITHDYKTPYEVVIDFLNSDPMFMNDTIVCSPEYHGLPIQFYCGDFLRIGGQLDEKTPLPVSKVRALPAPLFKDSYFPKWIFGFGLSKTTAETVNYFSRGKYKYVYGPELSLPVYSQDMTRPELPWHKFTKTKHVGAQDKIQLFRRILPASR